MIPALFELYSKDTELYILKGQNHLFIAPVYFNPQSPAQELVFVWTVKCHLRPPSY